jgi:hypothetical protein
MSRSLILALALATSAFGAILPERLGPFQLQPIEMKEPPISPEMAEDGADGWDGANYGKFTLSVWRFKDTTGAYAASLESSGVLVGNYLVQCEGKCPKDLPKLADSSLPHVSHAAIPTLDTYLPSKGLLARSERYIVGPVGLKADAPDVPGSAVNFTFGTEGEVARYRTPAGSVLLAVFSFPLPSMARQQLPEFQKIAGATAKRSGPLVAVAIGPAAASAQLLNSIDYQGLVSENDQPPAKPLELKPESAGKMVLAILSLAGILLGFCLLSGLAVGGTLRIARRFGYSAAEGSMITLHLEGK